MEWRSWLWAACYEAYIVEHFLIFFPEFKLVKLFLSAYMYFFYAMFELSLFMIISSYFRESVKKLKANWARKKMVQVTGEKSYDTVREKSYCATLNVKYAYVLRLYIFC